MPVSMVMEALSFSGRKKGKRSYWPAGPPTRCAWCSTCHFGTTQHGNRNACVFYYFDEVFVWKQGLLGSGDRLTFCDTLLNLSRRIISEIWVGGDRLTSRCVAVAVLRSTIQGRSFKFISLSQSHHCQQFLCGQQSSPRLQSLLLLFGILQILSELAAIGSHVFLLLEQTIDVLSDLDGPVASSLCEVVQVVGATAAGCACSGVRLTTCWGGLGFRR
jgi:hypothetical protein